MAVTFYATTAPGSAFLTDTRPPDLIGPVRLLNFATAGDVNRGILPKDDDAYHSLPAANATTRFEALADRALTQGGYIAWEGEAGGAASPGVRYALTGDGVSNEGSWLFDQPGALTRIAYHGSALDVLRARQPTNKIGFQFGLPSVTTVAAAAANPVDYPALLDAEVAAGLPAKVDYLIVTAFTPNGMSQADWRAKVDMDAATIAARYPTKPVMLMVNHTIGADNGSNYDAGFWRYQLDTAAEKGWDVLLYNLAGPAAPSAWAVVRGYPGASALTDYELLIYQRLKAILLAHAPLTTEGEATYIRSRNWVWYDGTADDPEFPTRDDRIPTDYPRIALEPGGRVEEHWEVRNRYTDHNVNATAASLARNKTIVFNYVLRITHKNLRLTMNSPVEAAVMTALRNSNPTLSVPGGAAGYVWVHRWGPLAVTRTMGVVEGDATATSRMQSVIPIPVYTLFNSADLLA